MATVSQRWAGVEQVPQFTVPLQPSGAVLQFCPAGQVVRATQLHVPQEQEAVQAWVPGPVGQVRVSPGMQGPSLVHGPKAENIPVAGSQVLCRVPHRPQAWEVGPSQGSGAWQPPSTQIRPATQSPLVVQGVHTPPPRHSRGLQDMGAPAVQRAATQVLTTRLSPRQAPSQTAPAAAPSAHEPAPSQAPVLPHRGLVGSLRQPPPGGSWPAPMEPQVPVLQVWHAPAHAVVQQTLLLEQKRPVLQSPRSWQGPPALDWPHLPAMQGTPMHWSLVTQLARHAGRAGSQAKPPQGVAAGALHAPLPSHFEAAVMLPLVQRASAQVTPAAYLWQAPAPLQVPSLPQPAFPVSLQVLLGSAPPRATLPQMPMELGSLHCWQTPLQRALQQTPWVQNALPHCSSREQGPPSGSLPHIPPTQLVGATQSSSRVHTVAQRLPSHLKPPQPRAAGAVQLPALQVLRGVSLLLPALHVSGAQTVPSAKVWQPPEPSHRPVLPHDSGFSVRQMRAGSVTPAAARGSGALAVTGTQRPRALGRAQ
jgi:hypothetical protein